MTNQESFQNKSSNPWTNKKRIDSICILKNDPHSAIVLIKGFTQAVSIRDENTLVFF